MDPAADLWHGDRPKEECGVVGLYDPDGEAARSAFFALFALQHRGQESAGIAVSDGRVVRMHKDMGLVNQVFDEASLSGLPGSMAVGHTRYSTSGASALRNAQPIFCTSTVGEIAVAHNGNLINSVSLRKELAAEGESFDTTADSELIARLLVRFLDRGPVEAVRETMSRIKGAYSVCVLTPKSVIAFRDPHGVRPLAIGRLGPNGTLVASESCAFKPVGGTVERGLGPGEVAVVSKNGVEFSQVSEPARRALCMFEFIYFARPDSVMYDTLLYTARERMGIELAKEHPCIADVVVPVPDSGIPAALGYSRESDIPYHEAMMKSRYIHRTFIQPDQRMREMGVQMKLSPMPEVVSGKKVVLVDDSIVRATTTGQIVRLMFESGATEVHVRITAPPIKWPCFYGIDMASQGELAAAKWSIDEIRSHIGASSLGYLSIEGAVRAVGRDKDSFCLACFNGDYPLKVTDDLTKMALENPPDVGQIASVGGQLSLLEP